MTLDLHAAEPEATPTAWSPIWPWLALALGVVVVVAGGVFFSPG